MAHAHSFLTPSWHKEPAFTVATESLLLKNPIHELSWLGEAFHENVHSGGCCDKSHFSQKLKRGHRSLFGLLPQNTTGWAA